MTDTTEFGVYVEPMGARIGDPIRTKDKFGYKHDWVDQAAVDRALEKTKELRNREHVLVALEYFLYHDDRPETTLSDRLREEGTCFCKSSKGDRKIRYASEQKAIDASLEMQSKRGTEFFVYQCRYGQWHLTGSFTKRF